VFGIRGFRGLGDLGDRDHIRQDIVMNIGRYERKSAESI
jgi:hypothetical protein